MAVRLFINPQKGTREDTSKISYTIENLPLGEYRAKIEDSTHSVVLVEEIYIKDTTYKGSFELNIPEHSSDSVISIFASIYKKIDNEYELYKICPSTYEIYEKEISSLAKNINIYPNFVGPNDICQVKVYNMPSQRLILSINDKRLGVVTNEAGDGSLSIRISDILSSHTESLIKKYPVYVYTGDDNFVSKSFSGEYLNVLPENIKTSVDTLTQIDPRCLDPDFDPASWQPPEYCFTYPLDPEHCPLEPTNPSIGLSIKQKETDDCFNQHINLSDTCRVNAHDSVLLPNGMVLHSYLSVDSSIQDTNQIGYNKNRVFIRKDTSAIKDATIIANRNVNVYPKEATEDIKIIVDYDVWDALQDYLSVTYYVVLYNSRFGYQEFIVNGLEIDPSYGHYVIYLDKGGTTLTIGNYMPCVNAVFYIRENPSIDITNITKLPFVMNVEETEALQIVDLSMSSNIGYVGDKNEGIVYIVVEAVEKGVSQLYLYSFSVTENAGDQEKLDKWVKLTYEFNNTNPNSYVDEASNLNIFWESDRSGISQIYRTVIGPSIFSSVNASMTALADKYAQMNSKEITSFDYTQEHILTPKGDEYDLLPRYPTDFLITDTTWDFSTSGGGAFSQSASGGVLNDVMVSGNPLFDSALGFVTFDYNNVLGIQFSDLHFQISTDIRMDLNQTDELLDGISKSNLSQKDIDEIYKNWKQKFAVEINPELSHAPVYVYENNYFTVGKQDNVFDRFIPLLGTYRKSDNLQIKFIEDNTNVIPFVLGVMLEKSYFKAYNIESLSEFCDKNNMSFADCEGYIADETHTIFTGNAKLVLLMKTDNKLINPESSLKNDEYIILREFPELINITEVHKVDILLHFSKLYYEDVVDIMNTARDDTLTRFMCSIYALIDEKEKCAESFLVDLNNGYNRFDIGMGIPHGGFYAAEKMYPSKMSIYDNIDVDVYFSDIEISSPTYGFNDSIISVPVSIKDELDLFRLDSSGNDVSTSENYFDNGSLSNNMIYEPESIFEAPVTIEGMNKSPYAKLGKCRDINLVWQSNRNRHWDIFYATNIKKTSPFGFDTRITNTTSNSLMPKVDSSASGKRFIVWHDNREGNYGVWGAKSLGGYSCNQQLCKVSSINQYPFMIDSCVTSFNFKGTETGNHHFRAEFYMDSNFSVLFKAISSQDDIGGWQYNGSSFESQCVYDNGNCLGIYIEQDQEAVITYYPKAGDGIFDRVLYVKLIALVS